MENDLDSIIEVLSRKAEQTTPELAEDNHFIPVYTRLVCNNLFYEFIEGELN